VSCVPSSPARHAPHTAALGVDRSYVGRMLRLTSLAPGIIEAILRGEEPNGLSLRKLQKDLPVQRDELRNRREGQNHQLGA